MDGKSFSKKIEKDSQKKAAARKKGAEIAFGLGAFGIVGWSVAIPAFLFTLLGVYLDGRSTTSISWTITMLFIGITIGIMNAWYWIKEKTSNQEEEEDSL